MFPSSAILEEMFPSGRDGNNIRRRYAISAIPGFKRRKGDVATFSGDRGSIREEYMLRHVLGFKWRKEMLRHVLGFKWRKGDVATFSGERGSYWRSRVIVRRLGFKSENGVHYLANRRTRFKCGDLRIICAEKFRGSRKA